MAAKIVVSPLHKVIDPGRWAAEGPLGRLFIVVHAAFLDSGFVPLPLIAQGGGGDGPVPREAGTTASALSFRYTAPQLLHRRNKKAAVAVLRQQVYGTKLVLYVQCGGRPVASSWLVIDALDAVSLLPGGLDATARALRRDARLAELWRGLSNVLCRRALVDLCRRNGVALEPTFMSLPDDAKVAILARLTDGADLARVERTCSAMRRLIAHRDRVLWKPLYDAIGHSMWFARVVNDSPELSWKERYVRARRRRLLLRPWRRSWFRQIRAATRIRPWSDVVRPSYPEWLRHAYPIFDRDIHPPEQPPDPNTEPRKWTKAIAGGKRDAGRGLQGERRRHGGGAIHAPSSRYRWKHR